MKKIISLMLIILSLIGIIITINFAISNYENEDFTSSMPKEQFNNEEPAAPPNTENSNREFERPNENITNQPQNNILTTKYILFISVFSLILSLSLLFIIFTLINKDFYHNKDKLIIYILSNIILSSIIVISLNYFVNTSIINNENNLNETSTKEEIDLDTSNVIEESTIDLDNQSKNVTITKGGTYTFNGSFSHSIIVNTNNEEVTIVLDNVEISNEETAAIIGLSSSKITIKLEDESLNSLSDGGNSEYDGCIYSNSELVFEGNGTLIINGNQSEGEGIATETQNITFNSGTYEIISNDDGINAGGDGGTITINDGVFYINASGDGIDSNEDAVINGGTIFVIGSDTGGDSGIDTEDGYQINGGLVIALGSDMIETPLETSKQKAIAFTLDSSIANNTIVTLMNEDNVIVSFIAPKSFKTIIISTSTLSNKTYTLYSSGSNNGTLKYGIYQNGDYTKGEEISINNNTSFTITKTINLFGQSR